MHVWPSVCHTQHYGWQRLHVGVQRSWCWWRADNGNNDKMLLLDVAAALGVAAVRRDEIIKSHFFLSSSHIHAPPEFTDWLLSTGECTIRRVQAQITSHTPQSTSKIQPKNTFCPTTIRATHIITQKSGPHTRDPNWRFYLRCVSQQQSPPRAPRQKHPVQMGKKEVTNIQAIQANSRDRREEEKKTIHKGKTLFVLAMQSNKATISSTFATISAHISFDIVDGRESALIHWQ